MTKRSDHQMKKKITRPDGSVEELEGTAEELAELENKTSKKGSVKEGKGKKNVLLGKEESQAELQRLVTEEVAKRTTVIYTIPWWWNWDWNKKYVFPDFQPWLPRCPEITWTINQSGVNLDNQQEGLGNFQTTDGTVDSRFTTCACAGALVKS
jgi:hypothetical protein